MQCLNVQDDAGKTVWKEQALRSMCGSWDVKATDMQAGYCIKLLILCCGKQKGKRTSENLWDKTHSKPDLVKKLWERRKVISLWDWHDDIKSYRTYTEICSIHIVRQSGVHLITCDLADCQVSLSAVAINVPKCLLLHAFLSCPNLYSQHFKQHFMSCLHLPNIFYIYSHVQNPTNSIL